uniref:Uncharacterized protein n=1 Tax=viral metagenome TaxID=1070528 RepID=A0A6M3JWB3_9ZZZZ
MAKYIKLSEDKYKKLLFQTRGQFTAILNIFRCYGMDVFVDQAINECMKITENFGQAVRGDDKPIHILDKPKERGIE